MSSSDSELAFGDFKTFKELSMFRDKLEFRYLQNSMNLLDERKTLKKKLQVLIGMCFYTDSKLYYDCVISDRNDGQNNFTFILTLPTICQAGDDVAFDWLSKFTIHQSQFRKGSNFIFHHHFIN